ncbi:MAG: hypothetical protein V1944_02425 [Candidatus Aenigmatarchaeota archaeon]
MVRYSRYFKDIDQPEKTSKVDVGISRYFKSNNFYREIVKDLTSGPRVWDYYDPDSNRFVKCILGKANQSPFYDRFPELKIQFRRSFRRSRHFIDQFSTYEPHGRENGQKLSRSDTRRWNNLLKSEQMVNPEIPKNEQQKSRFGHPP